MSRELFKKLERFRSKEQLSVVELCRRLDTHSVNYYRWKKAQKIIGAYKKLIEDFLARNEQPQALVKDLSSRSCAIAVIGTACYYPGASNTKELWENILARRVQFRRMLDQRLPLVDYYSDDAKTPEKTYLTKAAFLENFVFDWGRLRIPKKTVDSTDIVHWLALDTALRTFEDAGYKSNDIPLQNTSVIVGNTLTGEQTRSQSLRLRWPYVQKVLNATLQARGMSLDERRNVAIEMEQIYKSAFYPITEDSLAGGLANTIAGRICNFLNLKGGGYIVDGACSSSLLAVATAADALKMGNVDLALAGGVDVSLDPFELVGFAKAGALARDKMSVYDQNANGFLPGEGCGFILLKRLSDALRDKNYVYALIKGWGISSDGKGGIMEPSSLGQSYAIGRAYKDLDYKIADVDFVEGHGTGTTKGDRVELEGIATAIEQTVQKGQENKRSCGITSFKSIVGHTKAAAGIGGLIKAVLAVNQRILPPTASCIAPNEVFNDKARNLYPLIHGGILSSTKIARAGVSSAGFGGINCHVTVESYDKPKASLKPSIDERALFVSQQQSEVFVFTSRTLTHFKKIVERFKKDLRNISVAEMADLAALLNLKAKPPLPIKAAIVTDSPEHLYDALIAIEQDLNETSIEEGQIHRIKALDVNTQIILSRGFKQCRVGFLYPGQGSQRLNMTRVLTQRFQWARDLLDLSKLPLAEHIYKNVDQLFIKDDILEFEKQLSDTRITQPAIVASSMIWTEFLSRLNVQPQNVAGHSLGELTAFYKAGAFDQKTLIQFAELRGALMAANPSMAGGMVSLFCSKHQAEELVALTKGDIVLANINSPSQMIVSGGKPEIDRIIALAQKEDISSRRLNVSNAFHSGLMKSASEKIRASKFLPDSFKPKGIKIYSGMNAACVDKSINVKEYFSRQVVSPVDFTGLVEAISKECDLLIEVGPGRVLTDLVKAIQKGNGPLCLPVESTAQNDRDLNIVLAELFIRNVDIQWKALYENRLIRVFVPASGKKFIENQCEHPLKIGDQVLKVEETLGIRAPVADEVEQKEEVIPGGLPQGKDNIADMLVGLTHMITGFDKQSISMGSRLLDDLNLDSIKAAELIGQAARLMGVAGQIDPSKLSNNTLGEIRNRLFELSQSRLGASAQEEGTGVFKRYHDKTWVRNFIPAFRPEEITTRNVNQLKDLKNIVIVSEKTEDVFSDSIGKEFSKAKVQKIHFGEKPKEVKDGVIDCLIAVIPRSQEIKALNTGILKEILTRAHQVVDIAASNLLGKDAFVVLAGFGGGMKALVSTLFLERPELKVRVLDFDRLSSEGDISSKIIDELQTYERFSSVVYDAHLNRRVMYYENVQPVNFNKRGIVWSKKDVVLVSGGAKGITAACALEFARSTKARMILIGRSPVPEKADGNNEIHQTLEKFRKEGCEAQYYQCDVTNQKDVVAVLGAIERKQGRITGFIHGAGLNSLKRLKQSRVDEALKESLPKVMGAVNVCNALEGSLKLIVGITSIIGITGMEGSGWYGLANETLNSYLQQYKTKNPKTEVVTIAYSVWDEVGMGAKLGSVNKLAEKGIGAIPLKEGVRRFRQLVENDPGVQQVIVAARVAGIDTWRSPVLKTDGFRFIEKVEYVLPGVELIAKAQLNVQDDPYLLDHNWKGSLLFPFVFGLEAMTQAVACVLGVEKFDSLKVKNISLDRPINVPQETGTSIELHAVVLEQNKKGGHQEVKVEVYSQESAYIEPHFSAIFEVDPKSVVGSEAKPWPPKGAESVNKKVNEVIDIDIQKDIYGPILFQGKMFQCIDQIHELFYNDKTRKGECLLTLARHRSTEAFLKNSKKFNNRLLIGDPFFIDSMLQSMQLIIPQDLSLPRDIEAIEYVRNQENLSGNKVACSYIKRLDTDYYRGDAEVVNGGFLLKINNCRLKVLERILTNPSANDLVDPSRRYQKTIEDKLLLLSTELGFTLPVVRCLTDKSLINAKKFLRRKIELPLIKLAIEELLGRGGRIVKSFKVVWLKSGKPVVKGVDIEDLEVSISHAGSTLMVVAGHGNQGCDVETVIPRSYSQWLDLLGEEKKGLLKNIISLGQDLDWAGTAIWSAFEAARKALNKNVMVDIIEAKNDTILFEASFSNVVFDVVCFKYRHKVFTAVIYRHKGSSFTRSGILNELGYDQNIYKTDMNLTGPQGQPVFIQRFPVTFKNTQDLSNSVYFSNYFDWVGDIREHALYPIKQVLTRLFETGQWGMATNSVKLQILGAVRTDDVMEARLWLYRISGNKNSVLDLMFDWLKVLPGDKFERVATSEQRVSWLKITGHGIGKIESFPEEVKKFIDVLSPRKLSVDPIPQFIEQFKGFDIGKEHPILIRKPKDHFLKEEQFSTGLQESNLVGNIYFANYAKWLGKTRDNYFRDIIPDYYLGKGEKGEFICLNCEIHHLAEAMPFDKIRVKMYLRKIFDRGLDLYFDFFKLKNALESERLAYATHKVIFVNLKDRKFISKELPKSILAAIKKSTSILK